MNVDDGTVENFWRLVSGATGRAQMWRRWMHVLELRLAGKSWEEIGVVIDRSPRTAKQLHAKAVLETQRLEARCYQCGKQLTLVSRRYAPRSLYVFTGYCSKHGMVWSQEFKKAESLYHPGLAHRTPSSSNFERSGYSLRGL